MKTYGIWTFDLDGTLIDSGRCVIAAARDALEASGLPSVLDEQIIRHMGRPLDEFFRLLTSNQYADRLYAQLVHDYRDLYCVEDATLFPGVPELLTHLTDSGAVCTIATSKRTDFARRSCDHLGITEYFALIVGDDMVESGKPHPQMLYQIMETLGADRADMVMIGDATTDIEMGHAAGVDTIAVTWGAHSSVELRQVSPTWIFGNVIDLVADLK